MSLSQLLTRIRRVVPTELLDRFQILVHKLSKGKSCDFYDFFDRLNEPVRDVKGNEMNEFTSLNKASVIGE